MPTALPREVQFNGIGDFLLLIYTYYFLKSIALVGILGNCIIFVILLKNRKSSSGVTETLMINQSIVDLLMSVMLLVSAFVSVPERYLDLSLRSEFLCRIFRTQLPLTIFFSTSVYNLVTITVEQYTQIVHPVFYHNYMKNIKARVYICATWLIGIAFNLILTLSTSGINEIYNDTENNENSNQTVENAGSSIKYVCSQYYYHLNELDRRIAGLAISIIYYFVTVVIIVYSFLHILIRLHKKRYQVGPLGHTSLFRSVKISVVKAMSLFCSVFIVCWSLNSFVNVLFYFNLINESLYSSVFYSVGISIFYGCCAINPLLYVVRYRKFREAIWNAVSHCFTKLRQKKKSITNVANVAVIELNKVK